MNNESPAESLSSRLDLAEEGMSELEDWPLEIVPSEQEQKKPMKLTGCH